MPTNFSRKASLIAVGALAASFAGAQDPVRVDPNPQHYKVGVENDQVRVLHFTWARRRQVPCTTTPPRL